jgi:hypothetical protein
MLTLAECEGLCSVLGLAKLKRREFVRLLGGAAMTWPLAARAQQPDRMRLIGVLMGYDESASSGQALIAGFREGLQKLGWTEGRNTPDRHSLGHTRRYGVHSTIR